MKAIVLAEIPLTGFFTLGILSPKQTHLVLVRRNVPLVKQGKTYGYELHYEEMRSEKPARLLWTGLLPTTDPQVADKAFREVDTQLRSKKSEKARKTKAPSSMTESQLLCLAKSYPRTIEAIREGVEAFSHYQVETLAASGVLVGALNQDQFLRAARELSKAARRKSSAYEIGFELVAGWVSRGYRDMSPTERAEALRSLGLKPSSPEAIRKLCERLQLRSARKRGHP